MGSYGETGVMDFGFHAAYDVVGGAALKLQDWTLADRTGFDRRPERRKMLSFCFRVFPQK